MKSIREPAETRIFHGVIAQAPKIAQIYWPRRMLIYYYYVRFTLRTCMDELTLGERAERSVATEMEFAEILTPIEAIRKAVAQKNAAALPPCILLV
jgi:hypothetical protein